VAFPSLPNKLTGRKTQQMWLVVESLKMVKHSALCIPSNKAGSPASGRRKSRDWKVWPPVVVLSKQSSSTVDHQCHVIGWLPSCIFFNTVDGKLYKYCTDTELVLCGFIIGNIPRVPISWLREALELKAELVLMGCISSAHY